MTNEQCTNVAEAAWNLANEPGTNYSASVALKDCAFTIKELQARISELEKDAARWNMLPAVAADHQINLMALYRAIDSAMQKD